MANTCLDASAGGKVTHEQAEKKRGRGRKWIDERSTEPPNDHFKELVPADLNSALRRVGVDPKNPDVSKALEISLTMMFSGSLPMVPPPILREYQNIHPQLVDKFIEWTELQANHRRQLEDLRTRGSERRLDRSQLVGAVVAMGGLILAALVGTYGNMWAAIAIAVVSVGGPTAAIWLAHAFRQPPKSPSAPTPPPTPNPTQP